VIIITYAGDHFDMTEHVDQLVRLGKSNFRSDENTAYLMKLRWGHPRCGRLMPFSCRRNAENPMEPKERGIILEAYQYDW